MQTGFLQAWVPEIKKAVTNGYALNSTLLRVNLSMMDCSIASLTHVSVLNKIQSKKLYLQPLEKATLFT